MAQPFNLTVALNMKGPSNVKKIASDIQKQLGTIKANVDLNINANTTKRIAAINKQLKSLSAAAKTASSNVTGLNTALKGLSSSINSANNLSKTFNKTAASTGNNLKSSAQNIQQATTAVEEFGKQSALAVKRFAAFSIVTSVINQFTSAVSNSFQTFVDFDRQLVRISQVTGGSAADIKALSKEIGNLASSFGVASTDLAQVSVTLAQAGLTANQTKTALEALAKTSLAATFSNINNTTEGSIALMRQFKIGVQDLEASLGAINAVAGQFAVESSDIITAISRAGGVFSAASKGVSEGKDALNEFVAVFTSVRSTTRESAETIATGLRTIFTRIQRGSTIKFLREFGVELQDSQGKFVGAYEAIKRLSEGLQGLDTRDVKFTKIVEQLGGFRQIGKVIPLVKEFATAQEALGVAQRGAGSLTSDAVKAQMALAVQFMKTKEAFNSLIRDIGQSATFQTITKMILGMANAFISVAGALKPVLPLLTAITAIKGFKFITEFMSGFKGAFGGGGGGLAGALGGGGGGGSSGGGSASGGAGQVSQAVQANTGALTVNTTSLTQVTAALQQLNSTLGSLSGGGSGGGLPDRLTGLKFSSGGDVPGTGNRDTVPAMLQPGEFVIRKSAVEAFGRDRLAKINKYGKGGNVVDVEYEKTIDGDSLGVNFTPASKPYYTSSRLMGGDTYEMNSRKASEKKKAREAQAITEDWALDNRDSLEDSFRGANKYDKYGRPMFVAPDLLEELGGAGLLTGKHENYAKGGKTGDTVPAMLTPGEYVINKKSAQAFGYGNLKQINGYAQGGVVKNGVQHFSNGGMAERLSEAFSDQNIAKQLRGTSIQVKRFGLSLQRGAGKTSKKLSDNFRVASIQTQRLGLRLDEASKFTGSFIGTVSAGAAALGPAIDGMAESFDRLNGTTISTSEEFKTFSGGLKGFAEKGLSGSIAAQQAGFGRKGTAAIAGATALSGLVSGAIQGRTQARETEAKMQAGAANTRVGQAREDFKTAGNTRERLLALDEFRDASADYSDSIDQANAEFGSSSARFGRALNSLTDGVITALSVLAAAKMARGRSNGGPVYASKGQYVNFKPKGTDTIPAMLSPGEFVVNAKSTKQNKGLLESINKSKGGMISPRYLASGGMSDFDKYIKQGYSPSEARKMMESDSKTMGGRLSGAASSVGNFFGGVGQNIYGYGRNLSQFYNPFDNSKREMKPGDELIRNIGRGAMATAAVAGAGIAAAPALGALGGTGAVGTATNVGFGAMDAADFAADPSLATAGMLATNFIPGSGLVKGGARTVKAAKGATQVAKTAKASKTASKASKKGGGFFSSLFGRGKKATPGAATPPPTPLRRTPGASAPKPNANSTSHLRRNFIGPPPPPPKVPKRTPVTGKTSRTRTGTRKRGFGRGPGRGSKLGMMMDLGIMGASMLPAGMDAYSQMTATDAETQARFQQASSDRFAKIREGANMSGQSGDIDDPVAKRSIEALKKARGKDPVTGKAMSLDAQRSQLGKIAGSDKASANLVQEEARQQGLRKAGLDLDPGQSVEEFMKTAEPAQKAQAQAAIENADKQMQVDALVARRKREYEEQGIDAATAQLRINKELESSGLSAEAREEGDLSGFKASGKVLRDIEKEIGKAAMSSAKFAESTSEALRFERATASLTAVMTLASASMKRLDSEIGMIISSTNDLVAAYGGQASATSAVAASSAQENLNVLKNPTAFSEAELDKSLSSSVATLGGGAEVQQAADLTKAKVTFDKVAPQIKAALASADGQNMDAEGIENMVRQGFAGADIPAGIVDDFVDAATRDLSGGEGSSKNIENMLNKAGQAQKFLTQASELAAKGLKAVAAQSDQVSNSMAKQRQLGGNRDVRAAQQNLDARQAMGLSTSFEDLVAPSQARVRSLSSTKDLTLGTGDDAIDLTGTAGTTDPNQVFNNIKEMTDARESAISTARAEGPEAEMALTSSQSFITLNEQINASTKALEMLESDTTAADAALQKMAAREAQLGAQADTAMDMVADPSKALKFISDAQSFSRVQAGQGGQMDIGAAQNFLKGLQGTMSEENFGKLRESTAKGSARSMGLENEMQPFMPGFASTMEGKLQDPTMNREFQRLQTAGGVQNTAGERLGEIEDLKQDKLQQSIAQITDKVQNGMGPIIQQINTELQTFRDNVAAANGGGAGGAAGAPPPDAGAQTTPPANTGGLAGIPTQDFPSLPDTPMGRQATKEGDAIRGNLGVGGEVALTPTAPMQVEISVDPASQEAMASMTAQMLKDFTDRVGNAIKLQSNNQIDITNMV